MLNKIEGTTKDRYVCLLCPFRNYNYFIVLRHYKNAHK